MVSNAREMFEDTYLPSRYSFKGPFNFTIESAIYIILADRRMITQIQPNREHTWYSLVYIF